MKKLQVSLTHLLRKYNLNTRIIFFSHQLKFMFWLWASFQGRFKTDLKQIFSDNIWKLEEV